MAERWKADQADAEQDHHHHRRPDVGHVVEQRGEHAENRRIGEAKQRRRQMPTMTPSVALMIVTTTR